MDPQAGPLPPLRLQPHRQRKWGVPGVCDGCAQARDDRMRIRRPSRLRRIAKWIGLGACVAILCLWAISFWFIIYYDELSQFPPSLWHGRVRFLTPIRGWGSFSMKPLSHFASVIGPRTWWDKIDLKWPGTWAIGPGMGRIWNIPLWMPFAAVAIPTAILWRRDRRPLKGHCLHCGYNLTGNESGVCPECATPVRKRGDAA